MRRLVIVTALVGISGIVAPPTTASAADACADQVLFDWYDNGRVDRVYQLRCYEEAITALPPDLRDYTDAAEVIDRALQSAARQDPVSARAATAGPATSSHGRLLVLASASIALGLGAAAYLEWRRRSASSSRRP